MMILIFLVIAVLIIGALFVMYVAIAPNRE